jgi:ABC-type multidrug transport system ATPase subunit
VRSFGLNQVLKSATAWASPGRITVLLGRNGSGKTTLLRCSLGLRWAQQGVVRFRGRVYTRPRLSTLASHGLFFLPDRDLLSRRMRLRHQLEWVGSTFRSGHYADVVERLEIRHVLDAYPHEMSGGELRRAELALAVARRPRCLIADEPLTEIEPKDRDLVMAVLRDQAACNTAILITGHEVDDLLSFSDEVIWMAAGTTHGLGSPEEARAHHQFRREYLGPRFP